VRIVFLGTPETAVPTLEALIRSGHRPVLVVTRPDRPVGRGRNPSAPAVKRAAIRHDVEVFQPEKVRTRAFAERIGECSPDFLVFVAYGRILSRRVLDVAALGSINLHFSLLPRYRGAAPVQWALAMGEPTTGVTTILMNERMDEGDLLREREVVVEPGEHAPGLAARLAGIGAELVLETLAGLSDRTISPRPQDPAQASYAPILARKDGFIDLSMTASQIEGRIRGFDPWPGVWLRRGATRLRLVRAHALEEGDDRATVGTVEELRGESVALACGSGTRLLLHEVQPAGRRVMSARDALNGRQLELGDRLGAIGATG